MELCPSPSLRLQSQQSRLRKAYVTSPSDNNVILHGYVEYLASLYKLFCYHPVIGRWCRISTRVVMDQNDCRGPLRDRFPKHLSRVYERRIEEAASYGDVTLEPVLRIEHGD